jgi:uncharacterized membrane protein
VLARLDTPGLLPLLTLPLALFLPGYAVVAAAFPERPLRSVEHLLYAGGVSLALTVIGGLGLNLTPWGLRAESWAVLLGGVTLVAAAVAARRRPASAPSGARLERLGIKGASYLLLAAIMIGSAVLVADFGADAAPRSAFTQLWLLPTEGSGSAVQLGVRSAEQAQVDYRLELWSGERAIGAWPTLALAPDQSWEVTVELPADLAGQPIEALLYRQDAPHTVYRRAFLQTGRP